MVNSLEQPTSLENSLQTVKSDLDTMIKLDQESNALRDEFFLNINSIGRKKKFTVAPPAEEFADNLYGQLNELAFKIDKIYENTDEEDAQKKIKELLTKYFGEKCGSNINITRQTNGDEIITLANGRQEVRTILLKEGIDSGIKDINQESHLEVNIDEIKNKLNRTLVVNDEKKVFLKRIEGEDTELLKKNKLKKITFNEDSFDEYREYKGENIVEQIKFLKKELEKFFKETMNYDWKKLAGCEKGRRAEDEQYYSKTIEKTNTSMDSILSKYYGNDFPLEIEVTYREWHWNENGSVNIKINGNQIVYIYFDLDNSSLPEDDVELDNLAEIALLKMGIESGLEDVGSNSQKQNVENASGTVIDYSI